MKSVAALVLIYDIRGFTSATKRMRVADIGSFATEAHRSILDAFVGRPPTFVKNLGDGHLLLWETDAVPDPALLVDVVRRAEAGRRSFERFVESKGGVSQGLPRHVGIGIAFGEVSRSDDYYGVALNLASRLQNLARPEGLALDETVHAAVATGDAALRDGFRAMNVRLKGLGRTRIRVRRPFSWARLLAKAGAVAGLVALPLGYGALADLNVGVPGGGAIRSWLDGNFCVFRCPPSDAEVRSSASALRGHLTKALLSARTSGGWITGDIEGKQVDRYDIWSSSQSIYALTRSPEASNEDLRPCLGGLEVLFDEEHFLADAAGKPYGWQPHPGEEYEYPQAEPNFWTVAALASALARPGLVPAERRAHFAQRLSTAQQASSNHHPLEDGGWNMFPSQKDLSGHSPYSTVLALLALLESRRTDLGWAGDRDRLDRWIRLTCAYLVRTFKRDASPPGWLRTQDPLDIVSPGLTLQGYALLLDAEAMGLFALPDEIGAAVRGRVERLETAAYSESGGDAGEFAISFRDEDGSEEVGKEGINFLWHPWAIATARRWLDRAERLGAPASDRIRFRRALGHLVIDLSHDARTASAKGYAFVAAETLVGLSTIRVP